MKKIKVEYFAKLREERKLNSETIETEAKTAAELYSFLKEQYKFGFTTEHLRVAINDEFQEWDTVINDSDTIVFIPPVAGG